jgi:hypothetical protein
MIAEPVIVGTCLGSPGIDPKESIPPANVADMITLFVAPARQVLGIDSWLLKRFQIRALQCINILACHFPVA